MNALSPFSSLIAPAPAGWAAGSSLVAPVETVPAPDGFAGWLPTTAPLATSACAAVSNVLTTMPVPLAGNVVTQPALLLATPSLSESTAGVEPTDPPQPAPALATSPVPKPIGGVQTADLRLPLTTIASSTADGGATRSFVPKTMPIPGTGTLEPGTADVQPLMIAASADPVVAAAPSQVVDPIGNGIRTATKAQARTSAVILVAQPVTVGLVDSPARNGAVADPIPSEETTDPVATPATTTGRKDRIAKRSDDASAVASAMLVDTNLAPAPNAPAAAAAGTPPQVSVDSKQGETPEREARTRPTGGTTPAVQALPASAPVAGTKNPVPVASASAQATAADGATSTSEATSVGKAVASDPTTPERATGEAKPATPSFRAHVDAVQQASKPAATQSAAQPAPAPVPVAQASRIGHDTAIAIARHVANDGGESLTIRIAPAELGRIEVRLAFDEGGTLRATVAADQPASLDLLRRDTESLVRALGDAGVRADSDSLRFDTRSDTGSSGSGFASSGQSGGGGQGRRTPFSAGPYATLTAGDEPATETRILSPRGRVDLMA